MFFLFDSQWGFAAAVLSSLCDRILICPTRFGSLPHTQQEKSNEAGKVKLLKVSLIACDVQDAIGQMSQQQPEHSLPGTVL